MKFIPISESEKKRIRKMHEKKRAEEFEGLLSVTTTVPKNTTQTTTVPKNTTQTTTVPKNTTQTTTVPKSNKKDLYKKMVR